jgi:predicted DNA binding protein
MALWRISLELPSAPLIEAGLLPGTFFRHNESIEILRVYAFQPRERMLLARITRSGPPWTREKIVRQRALLRRRYRLRDFEILDVSPDGRTYVALVRQANPGILEQLLEELGAGVTPTPPTILGRERATLSFLADEAAEARIMGLLGSLSVPFALKSRRRIRGTLPGDEGSLTARQRELLSLAWNLGYFDVPAKVGLRKIAELSGLSRNAVSQHLRRGVRNLLRTELG